MSQETIRSGNEPTPVLAPLSKFANIGLLIPVTTVFAFIVVYYSEVGAFARYDIPTEYIQVQLIDAVKYMPLLFAALYYVISFTMLAAVRVVNPTGFTIHGLAYVAFFLVIFALTFPTLPGTGPLVYVVALTTIASACLSSAIVRIRGTFRFRINITTIVEFIGASLFGLIFSCILSFWIGYLKFPNDGKDFFKNRTTQLLVRKYDGYAIYCITDTTGRKLIYKAIIIDHDGGKIDTLFGADLKNKKRS